MSDEPKSKIAPIKRKPVRKKRQGAHFGGRTGTPLQLEMQEQAFFMAVDGYTCRQIGVALGITKDTANRYIRTEQARRAEALAEQRDQLAASSVAFYEGIKRRAVEQNSVAAETMVKIRDGTLDAKVSDRSLSEAIHAQERIDKIMGLDAPAKLDISIAKIVEAFTEPDDPKKALEP